MDIIGAYTVYPICVNKEGSSLFRVREPGFERKGEGYYGYCFAVV